MNQFEKMYRKKIKKYLANNNLKVTTDEEVTDPIKYTRSLTQNMKNSGYEKKIALMFESCACHLPHEQLEGAKEVFVKTQSIKAAHARLEQDFIRQIKAYKNLTDDRVNALLKKGMGLAGTFMNNHIYVTKIPSRIHEYDKETDVLKKTYYYCHCPRVRSAFLNKDKIDVEYCYCGGGFYKDVWEYITNKPVKITLIRSLFNNDDVCQFRIDFS